MTAKTDKGTVVPVGKKEYWELGMDMDGYHRTGAWQIKEVIDLTPPPRKTTKERFVAELPEGTTSRAGGALRAPPVWTNCTATVG